MALTFKVHPTGHTVAFLTQSWSAGCLADVNVCPSVRGTFHTPHTFSTSSLMYHKSVNRLCQTCQRSVGESYKEHTRFTHERHGKQIFNEEKQTYLCFSALRHCFYDT